MKVSSRTQRVLVAGLAAALALITFAAIHTAVDRRADAKAPVAAYLIPIDHASFVRGHWWGATPVTLPLAIRSGEELNVPAGSRIRLFRASSSKVEIVAGPAHLVFAQKVPSETEALISPLPEVLAEARTVAAGNLPAFAITSPAGVTRYLNPLITWTARPGVKYDVAVLDAADPFVPPRTAQGVSPPIALSALETPQRRQLGSDRNYEVVVRETGARNLSGATRCLTAVDASLDNQRPVAADDRILEASLAMAKRPSRTGDAWLALSGLPSDWAATELGIRLRLAVAMALGDRSALQEALAAADPLSRHMRH